MSANQAEFPIATMARVLGVSACRLRLSRLAGTNAIGPCG